MRASVFFMAFAQPGPGQQPMQPGQEAQLRAALSRVGPPQNPKTPAQRTDPQHEWLIALQRVRATVADIIRDHLDDKPQPVQDLILAMNAAMEKTLAGIDPNTVSLLAGASIVKSIAPQVSSQLEMQAAQGSRPPMVPGMPSISTPPTGLGVGPGVQAPTAGGPPPVSPPAPGGQPLM